MIGLFSRVVSGTCQEIQPAQERNDRHFRLRNYAATVARVNVLQNSGIGIGSLCCQRTAGATKCFEQIGREKEQAELIEMVTRNHFMREQQAPRKQFTEAAKRPNEFP